MKRSTTAQAPPYFEKLDASHTAGINETVDNVSTLSLTASNVGRSPVGLQTETIIHTISTLYNAILNDAKYALSATVTVHKTRIIAYRGIINW